MTAIRVGTQNCFYTQSIPCAATDDVIVLSGSWFLGIGAPNTPDFASFISKTQAQVETRLQAFLNGHPDVSPAMTGILMIDIEDPHPQDMHTRPVSEQDQMIAAFKVRIAATRAKFPNAKITLYGTLNPDGRGRANNPTYLARLAALVRAGQQGMFDGLDYLSPVLYIRFGPTDNFWNTIAAYTQLGVDGSSQLKRSGGESIPLLPFTGLWVANGNSQHNDQILLDLPTAQPLHDTLGVQWGIFQAAGIADAVIWVGEDSDLILHQPNPNNRTVSQHVCGTW